MRGKNPLEKLKGIHASGLPPCESEVMTHLKQVAFVAKIWANENKSDLEEYSSGDDGWTLDDGVYNSIWFDGPQVPDALVPDDNEMDNSDESIGRLEAYSSDEGDTSEDEELEDSISDEGPC